MPDLSSRHLYNNIGYKLYAETLEKKSEHKNLTEEEEFKIGTFAFKVRPSTMRHRKVAYRRSEINRKKIQIYELVPKNYKKVGPYDKVLDQIYKEMDQRRQKDYAKCK